VQRPHGRQQRPQHHAEADDEAHLGHQDAEALGDGRRRPLVAEPCGDAEVEGADHQEMTGLIFAKTMSPTTMATVIAVFSRSAAVSPCQSSSGLPELMKPYVSTVVVSTAQPAPTFRRALGRMPLGDFLEVRVWSGG
jgi:hypothetical protein